MAFPPPCPDPCPRSWAATPPSSVLGRIYSLRWGKSQVPREGEREMQGQSKQRPHSGAGSGRLPAGGWPETPVWFEFPAPHSLHQPAAWLRAARSVPYLGLFSPPPPTRWHSVALKGRPGGRPGEGCREGQLLLLAPEPLQLYPCPWLSQPIPLAVGKTRPPEPDQPGWPLFIGVVAE